MGKNTEEKTTKGKSPEKKTSGKADKKISEKKSIVKKPEAQKQNEINVKEKEDIMYETTEATEITEITEITEATEATEITEITEATEAATPVEATEIIEITEAATPVEATEKRIDNRRVSAGLKKAACIKVRSAIRAGTLLEEYAKNPDFLNTLRLAVGYKEEEVVPNANLRTRMYGKLQAIETMFTDGHVSEQELFDQYAIGRAEMMAVRRKLATKEDAKTRLYIKLNQETKVWETVGNGETMPEGFHLQTRRRHERAVSSIS